MNVDDHPRRFDLNWLLGCDDDEEADFAAVDALLELSLTTERKAVDPQSRDAAIERLYTEGGIFCPLCGAVYDAATLFAD